MKTVVLDLDDFSVLRSRMDLLLKIKEHYPKFKVSLFTIPYDYEYETSPMFRTQRPEALKLIHENLDFLQIIPHGLLHLPGEFQTADRKAMEKVIQAIDEPFKKDELPYEKGFKAPYWLWTQDVVDVLDEKGWWGAVDPNQPAMPCPKRFYKYKYSIDEPFWESKDEVLKIHGHITLPSSNNLEDCLLNIFKLPNDVEWGYVTDYLEEKS